ncbi:DNA polymerase epsilon subunit 3 [Hetaerina americana]|uniref:DNA polymerase epsilon subunit 3 n=1 Tax=Hetaerina americana TaxID=62018 RepID=UPI003A7F2DD4
MAERPEDLNLPNAAVMRLVKEAIPDGIAVGKEARNALAKAASVFILYLTSLANNLAIKNNRKTISGQDVINALEDGEFHQFVGPLKEALEAFRKGKKEKKDAQAKRRSLKEDKKKSDSFTEDATNEDDDIMEVAEDA